MDAEPTAGAKHCDASPEPNACALQHLIWRCQRVGNDADFGRMRFLRDLSPSGRQMKFARRKLYVLRIAAIAFLTDKALEVIAKRLEIGTDNIGSGRN